MRTTRLFLAVFAFALILQLLLACSISDEPADGPSSEPTTAKEEGVFWIFEEEGVSWVFEKTRLISRYPSVNWERVTYLLYWSLRISVFALPVLLFIVSPHPQVPPVRRPRRWLPPSARGFDHAPQRPSGPGSVGACQTEGRPENLPVHPRGHVPEGQLDHHRRLRRIRE